MAHPVLAELTATVTQTVGVVESATTFINGVAAKIAEAVAAALALGASAAELEPFVALETELENKSAELSAAIAANSGGPSPSSRR